MSNLSATKLLPITLMVAALAFAMVAYGSMVWSNCGSSGPSFFDNFQAFHTRAGC